MNPPFRLPLVSCYDSCENLVVHQDNVHLKMPYLFLIICLLLQSTNIAKRKQMWITHLEIKQSAKWQKRQLSLLMVNPMQAR